MTDVSTSAKLSRSDQLRQIARQKSESKRHATFQAIRDLADPQIGRGRPITQAAVAKRAGVSTVFLRSHDDLLQAINDADKARPAACPAGRAVPRGRSAIPGERRSPASGAFRPASC